MLRQVEVAGTAIYTAAVDELTLRRIEFELGQLELTKQDTQSKDTYLTERSISLKQTLYELSNMAWDALAPGGELRVTQCWKNIVRHGGSHRPHIHPNSMLSGILMLTDNPTRTIFQRHSLWAELPLRYWDEQLEEMEGTPVAASRGRVLLFPSVLEHRVEHNKYDDRETISWNTWPKGTLMGDQTLCQLRQD